MAEWQDSSKAYAYSATVDPSAPSDFQETNQYVHTKGKSVPTSSDVENRDEHIQNIESGSLNPVDSDDAFDYATAKGWESGDSYEESYDSLRTIDPSFEDDPTQGSYSAPSNASQGSDVSDWTQSVQSGGALTLDEAKEDKAAWLRWVNKKAEEEASYLIEKAKERRRQQAKDAEDLKLLRQKGEYNSTAISSGDTSTQVNNGKTASPDGDRLTTHADIHDSVRDKDAYMAVDLNASDWWTSQEKLAFQFFGDMSFPDDESVEWNDTTVIGRSENYKSYASTGNREITLSLKFQAEGGQEDSQNDLAVKAQVFDKVNWLKSLKYPTYKGDLMYPPPIVRLNFGKLFPNLRGIITSASAVWGAEEAGFWGAGLLYPLAASVDVTFTVVNESPISAETVAQGRSGT
jgi:hypothetical protein